MARGKKKVSGIDKRISKIFRTPELPGSYSGVQTLYREVNADRSLPHISGRRVKKWLKQNRAFTLHQAPTRKFKRRKVVVPGIYHQYQTDLIEMPPDQSVSDDIDLQPKFVLVLMDVFSKYAWARALKNKSADEVLSAFKDIFNSGAPKPRYIQSDKGSEFVNKKFKQWATQQNIKLFSSEDDRMKSSQVERINRTLKQKLSWHSTDVENPGWVSEIPSVLKSYNNTYHRSIKITPASVNYDNQHEVFFKLYPPPKKLIRRADLHEEGEFVRLQNAPKPFDKGYKPKWTKEIFVITEAKTIGDGSIRIYKVQDLVKQDILGYWYHFELQPSEKPGWIIQNVVEEDGDKLLIKWLDRPAAQNSYILKKHRKNFMSKPGV